MLLHSVGYDRIRPNTPERFAPGQARTPTSGITATIASKILRHPLCRHYQNLYRLPPDLALILHFQPSPRPPSRIKNLSLHSKLFSLLFAGQPARDFTTTPPASTSTATYISPTPTLSKQINNPTNNVGSFYIHRHETREDSYPEHREQMN